MRIIHSSNGCNSLVSFYGWLYDNGADTVRIGLYAQRWLRWVKAGLHRSEFLLSVAGNVINGTWVLNP